MPGGYPDDARIVLGYRDTSQNQTSRENFKTNPSRAAEKSYKNGDLRQSQCEQIGDLQAC